MIQLQVLVTDRDGNPVRDLEPADFEIEERGVRRPVENRLRLRSTVPLEAIE